MSKNTGINFEEFKIVLLNANTYKPKTFNFSIRNAKFKKETIMPIEKNVVLCENFSVRIASIVQINEAISSQLSRLNRKLFQFAFFLNITLIDYLAQRKSLDRP
jgi:hypothetical protein